MISESTKELRECYLASSESDVLDAGIDENKQNIRLSIKILGMLPMLGGNVIDALISNPVGTNGILDTLDHPVEVSVENVPSGELTLPDTSVVERFSVIGKVKSVLTNVENLIVYDGLFSDILILPDLDSFGTGTNADMYANRTIEVHGYVMGYGAQTRSSSRDMQFPIPTDKSEVGIIAKPAVIKTILANVSGFAGSSVLSNGNQILANTEVGGAKLAPTQYATLSIGTEQILPLYNMLQRTGKDYTLDFVGNRPTTTITFPLNF